MTLAPGTRLGPYEIAAPLGAGGMGEVYRARDSRLGREVAVKVLPAVVASDAERLRRFEQEARAASALNHPNLLTLFDVGADGGTSFLVTELLEGESLRELLREGPVTPKRAVELVIQIAKGLAAAHEKGIVHRDLKPENLFLTRDGTVKILDFGLARVAPPSLAGSELGRAPTVEALTGDGTVLGTAGYMSPEQVRGEPADARSDLFSLGCVLYELVTGRRAFDRETPAEAMTAILRDEPPGLASSSSALPPPLRRILRRALAKAPADRFPSARELALQLGEVFADEARPPARRLLRIVFGVLSAVLVTGTVAWLLRGRTRTEPVGTRPASVASIAVLPLENLTGEADLDYLGLALADGMTTLLARTPTLAVRPFGRARAVAAEQGDPAAAGRALHAAAVLTGQLLAVGADLRLALEALDVAGNRVLWRESVAVERGDLLALDREIAQRIELELLPALGFVAAARAAGAVPRHPEAYDLYLRSVALPWVDSSAIDLLQRSVVLDPEYAPAWSALGLRHYADAHYGSGGEGARERSLVAFERSLALDPESIEAVTGFVYAWTEAGDLETAYDAAAALVAKRPDSAIARGALAYTLRYGGLHDRALELCEQGVRLDARESHLGHCAWIALEVGDYARTRAFMRIRSESEWHHYVELFLHLSEGHGDRARERAALLTDPGWGVDFLVAHLEGAAPDEVRRRFLAQRASGYRGIVDGDINFKVGALAAQAGLPDLAIEQLRRGLEIRFCGVAPLALDPLLEPLRGRPEFAGLRRDADACSARFVAHLREVESPYAPGAVAPR